jgi:hypothetical protein
MKPVKSNNWRRRSVWILYRPKIEIEGVGIERTMEVWRLSERCKSSLNLFIWRAYCKYTMPALFSVQFSVGAQSRRFCLAGLSKSFRRAISVNVRRGGPRRSHHLGQRDRYYICSHHNPPVKTMKNIATISLVREPVQWSKWEIRWLLMAFTTAVAFGRRNRNRKGKRGNITGRWRDIEMLPNWR